MIEPCKMGPAPVFLTKRHHPFTQKMQIATILDFLESKAPLALQESYDNCGLLLGQREWEARAALLCLDCTPAVVDEAIARECNLIISHHPLIFKGLSSITGKSDVEKAVIQAIRHDIAVYAIHTNLDNVAQGVNAALGACLGLENLEILAPMANKLKKLVTYVPEGHLDTVSQALFAAGAGAIGKYDQCGFTQAGMGSFRARDGASPYVGQLGIKHLEPEQRLEVVVEAHMEQKVVDALLQGHPYEEVAYDLVPLSNVHKCIGSGMVGTLARPMSYDQFAKHLKKSLDIKALRASPSHSLPIHKVAICGGSGVFLMPQAKRLGAQAFVTADAKYHDFFETGPTLSLFDIGHYESERFTIQLLHSWLSEKFPTFAGLITELNTNPVNYL